MTLRVELGVIACFASINNLNGIWELVVLHLCRFGASTTRNLHNRAA